VTFTSLRKHVTMAISCSGGTPSTATTVTIGPDE
jgi:hypothetical protein